MKSRFVKYLFFLPIIILGVIMMYYRMATNANRVEVIVTGYDPKDFLAGYYMNLQLNWDATDCTQFTDSVCPKKDFDERYKFYIKREQSDKLTKAVNAGIVKLVFSYVPNHKPYVVDLLADNQSYIEYLNTADD
ncbi:MAG: hypothetical protein IJ770_02935 [Alphaproteobacteria bacterium]|nr:hypothetical protein [Alphaproteobacteria bacterium]